MPVNLCADIGMNCILVRWVFMLDDDSGLGEIGVTVQLEFSCVEFHILVYCLVYLLAINVVIPVLLTG